MSVASIPRPMMFDMKQIILPTPGAAFAWRPAAAGPALVCVPLEPYASHLFTTRSWKLGQSGGPEMAADAWLEVATAISVPPDMLVRLRQVHGSAAVVASPGGPPAAADIVMTADPALALAVQAADCVPLLVADPRTGATAAAHAGWRGLAAHVPHLVVDRMASEFGSRAEDLMVALGPSIGACCYEVGEDVRAAFEGSGCSAAQLARWF